jgi:hypothetical protein
MDSNPRSLLFLRLKRFALGFRVDTLSLAGIWLAPVQFLDSET